MLQSIMRQRQLIESLAGDLHLDETTVEAIIAETVETIQVCLLRGDSVDIAEFGSFALRVGTDQRGSIHFSPHPDILTDNPPANS